MTEFFAQPYSVEHTGFYFNSIEVFEAGMEQLNKRGCEEVEIQFIDGEDHLASLADRATITQGDINFWFDELEDLEEDDVIRLNYLLGLGYSMEDAKTRYEWVYLYHGTAVDYACEIISETTEIPENLSGYIDYEAIARDMKLNSEIDEIKHNLIVTNALEL